MNSRSFLLLLAVLFSCSSALFAGTAEAEKRLQTAVDAVIAVANRAKSTDDLAADVRPLLLKYISFETMTRRAVGPGWKQFSGDQQKKATQLFTTLIIRSYSSKFTIGEHAVVKYKAATEPAPGRVEIPTTLRYKGSDYQVTYRIEEAENGKITDIVAEGVSLIANYRSQLDAQFKKGGVDAVISSLNQTVEAPK